MTSINLSSNAVKRIQDLLPSHKSTYFRVYVTGGGCSGFQYEWGLTDKPLSDPIDDVLVVDPIAEMYIIGCTIDYVSELGGSFLKISNPNATASCGCGESFAV